MSGNNNTESRKDVIISRLKSWASSKGVINNVWIVNVDSETLLPPPDRNPEAIIELRSSSQYSDIIFQLDQWQTEINSVLACDMKVTEHGQSHSYIARSDIYTVL